MKKNYLFLIVGLIWCPTILLAQFSVSGKITRHNGDPVPDIQVNCDGSVNTDADGNFEFTDVAQNFSCELTPMGVFDKYEDVTVLDLLVIIWYIFEPDFNINGYEILACDLIDNEYINGDDMVRTIRLALRKDVNTSDHWQFVDADHIFANPLDPLGAVPTFISVNASDTITGVDFVAIKRGDPAISTDYTPPPPEALSPTFFISNESFQIGDTVEFEVTVEDFSNIIGFQQTFKWDSNILTFESAESIGGIFELNNDLVDQGLLATLTIRDNSPLQDGEIVMKLKFIALSDVSNPTEVVSFSDEITQRQVVWQNPVGIDFFIVEGEYESSTANTKIINAVAGLEFFQVFPNPTQNDIYVKALLKNAEDFEISILNVLGQKVYSENFDQKELLLEIDCNEFSAGTYFLSLKTADGIQTESFIKN